MCVQIFNRLVYSWTLSNRCKSPSCRRNPTERSMRDDVRPNYHQSEGAVPSSAGKQWTEHEQTTRRCQWKKYEILLRDQYLCVINRNGTAKSRAQRERIYIILKRLVMSAKKPLGGGLDMISLVPRESSSCAAFSVTSAV